MRQYRSNQGRSPERMAANYKVMGYAIVGMAIALGCLIISNLLEL